MVKPRETVPDFEANLIMAFITGVSEFIFVFIFVAKYAGNFLNIFKFLIGAFGAWAVVMASPAIYSFMFSLQIKTCQAVVEAGIGFYLLK